MLMKWHIPALLAGIPLLVACSGCRTGPRIEREDPGTVIDYSGQWNDTDAQTVAAAMTEDCLKDPWIDDFVKSNNGQKPVVVVGHIRNNSHEHIDTEVFTKSFERELVRSGKVRVVAESQMRADIREERKDIQLNADPATIRKFGKEIGADFILLGAVRTVRDEVQQRYVMYYQTNLELLNVETNEKAWIGAVPIKKDIKRKAWRLF
jgi:uncharacterized protein (TIGR02722 family)